MAEETDKQDKTIIDCGIIMPISPIDGLPAEHWKEVLSILKDVIIQAGFTPNLVSDSDEVGIIQRRIVQNIYNNPIIVCDVSAKNPNVMFELGMRLAFDKATIIIKDDKTDYSFDTSPIEHLTYPRDLRFNTIIKFKEKLKEKIEATYKKSIEDPNYTTFLKHFGEYKLASISEKEITTDRYLLNSIEQLKDDIQFIKKTSLRDRPTESNYRSNKEITESAIELVNSYVRQFMMDNEYENSGQLALGEPRAALIKYLEGIREVRQAVGSNKNLNTILNATLDLPF